MYRVLKYCIFFQMTTKEFVESGAHQLEPPSPLIPWVNPFPSKFINRTAYFPQNVSYFRESRMSRWKNKVGGSRNQKPILRPCIFLSFYAFIFMILQPLGSGYHEIKVNWITQLRRAWSNGTKVANWDHWKVIFASVVFNFLPSYIPHVSMHFKKHRWLSVLWTIWNFSMISAEKVPELFDFCHHCGVDFAS